MATDFSKRYMAKHGWSEGQGIGKNLQGRKRHIKVSFKADTAGLGSNPADSMTNSWWAKSFNKSAKRLRRRNDSDCSLSSDSSSDEEVDDFGRKLHNTGSNKLRIRNARQQLYSAFIHSGTLKGDKTIESLISKKAAMKQKLKELKQRRKDKLKPKVKNLRGFKKYNW